MHSSITLHHLYRFVQPPPQPGHPSAPSKHLFWKRPLWFYNHYCCWKTLFALSLDQIKHQVSILRPCVQTTVNKGVHFAGWVSVLSLLYSTPSPGWVTGHKGEWESAMPCLEKNTYAQRPTVTSTSHEGEEHMENSNTVWFGPHRSLGPASHTDSVFEASLWEQEI